jgi:hypothetical protein
MERIEIIRQKLEELKAKDVEFMTFGSKEAWAGHEYELYPVVEADYLAEIEREANIVLPEEYKIYLTQVADGGAGPCYGLYPVKQAIERTMRQFKSESEYLGEFFAPFPLPDADVAEYLRTAEEHSDDDFEAFPAPDILPGILYLAEYGCGGYYVLIVSGEQHGKVWFCHSDGYLNPCYSGGQQHSFFDWFERWLDTSLARLSNA